MTGHRTLRREATGTSLDVRTSACALEAQAGGGHKTLSPLSQLRQAAGRFGIVALATMVMSLMGTSTASAATYYSRATGNWNSNTTWSLTSGGAAVGAGVFPGAADTVNIEGNFTVTVTANASATAINFGTAANTSTLSVNSGVTLAVSGAIAIPRAANGGINTLAVGAGTVTAASLTLSSGGTTNRHQVTISTGTLAVTGNVAGTANQTSGTITFSGAGTLRVGGTLFPSTDGTITFATGSTVDYSGVAQTVQSSWTYNNLTLSGSGAKTLTGVTVNGVLSMEGTATASVAPTFGAASTIQYNTATARTAGVEWPASFAGTGGVIIANTGTITLNNAKTLTAGPLTINNGSALDASASNFNLTLAGDFVNNGGTFTPRTTTVTFNGTTQAISGTGTTSFSSLTINAGSTLTISQNINVSGTMAVNGTASPAAATVINSAASAGTINGSGTALVTRTAATADYLSQYKFNTQSIGSLTVNYSAAAAQTISGMTYGPLTTSGSGTKTFGGAVTASTLTVGTGTTVNTDAANNYGLTLSGNLVTTGTFTANGSNITLTGTAAQAIAGFTTTGTVTSIKTSGTATFGGNVSAGTLTLSSAGVINLGTALTHTITDLNLTAGTLDGGSSTLNIAGSATSGGTFTANTGTVNYTASGNQTVAGFTYNNLGTSGSGVKSLSGALAASGTVTIGAGTTLDTTAANNYAVSFSGSFTNNGSFTANASNITIAGTGTQTIAGFTTTGSVTMTKTGGTATMSGGINAASLTTNGTGGTLALSTFTHTITGNWNLTAGTLTMGAAGVLNVGGNGTFTAGTFTPGTSSVVYNGGAQNVAGVNYQNLTLSGSGAKTLATGTTSIGGALTMLGSASTTTVVGTTANVLVTGSGTTLNLAGFAFTVSTTSTIGGTVNITSATGTKQFTGNVNVTAGATWNNSGNSPINFRGGLTNGGTFTAGTGVHTFDTNAQALSGTLSIPSVTVTGITLTNNGDLTVGTALSGTGGLTQGPSDILTLGGTSGITTLTATATGNVVNYTGAAQTVNAGTYATLNLQGTNTKTAGGNITVSTALTQDAGVTFSLAATTLTVGGTYTNAGTLSAGTSTVVYSAAGAQTVANGAYNNLTLSTSGNKTLNNGSSVVGVLAITGTAKADVAAGATIPAGSLTLGGNGTANGTWGSTASAASFTNDTYFTLTTGVVNVSSGTPSKLTITQQPSSTAQAGIAFAQQPIVAVQDFFGNTITSSTAVVTVARSGGTGTLQGTSLTATAVNGVADFSPNGLNLTLITTAALQFTSPGLTSATSTNIAVTHGTATQLVITTQPPTTTAARTNFATSPVVQVRDAFGNNVTTGPDATASVTVALFAGAGTLSGTTTVSAAAGSATFGGLSIDTPGTSDKVLRFTSGSLTAVNSNAFSITPVTKTATAGTTWAGATWSPVGVPQVGDAVIINAGVNLNVSANAVAWSVQVGSNNANSASSLTIAANTSLTVGTSITLGNANNSAQDGTITFSSGSSVTLGGTLTLGTGTGAGIINMTAGGTLTAGALTVVTTTGNSFTAGSGEIVMTGTNTFPTTIFTALNNLTLASGATTLSASTTVNGILSMEGGTVAGAAPTYVAATTVQYNLASQATTFTTGLEWPNTLTTTTTNGVAVVVGTVTLNAAKTLGSTTNAVPLAISAGATLDTAAASSFGLTFYGNFTNNGTLTANNSAITIGAGPNVAQSIGGFTGGATSSLVFNRTTNTATLTGNVTAGALTINGTGGTLNLGSSLTHTFSGTWTRTAGTLNGGSSTLNLGGAFSGTGGTFTAGSGTVNYNASGAQSVALLTYNNLVLSGSGVKAITTAGSTTLATNLTISGSAQANVSNTLVGVTTLTLGTGTTAAGRWGRTGATNVQFANDTYFVTGAGTINVGTGVASVLRVETAANGSGTVVPAQNLTAGNTLQVFAIARDSFNNFVSNPSATWSLTSITGGVLSTNISPTTGTSTTMTGGGAGTALITATFSSFTASSGTITVVAAAATRLVTTLPGQTFTAGTGNAGSVTAQTAGTPFTIVSLTATDGGNNVDASYSGTKTITYTGPGGVATYTTSVDFTNGVSTTVLTTTLTRAETVAISVTDGTLSTFASSNLVVNPNTVAQLQVLMPGETAAGGTVTGKTGSPTARTAGTSFTVTVNATDAYWNLVSTAAAHNIAITSSDANLTPPANNTLAGGTRNFTVTFRTANNPGWTITATDVTGSPTYTADTGSTTLVNAGAVNKIQILAPGETAAPGTATGKTGTPTTQTAGSAFNVTVNAVDANWNPVTATNNIVITTSDANDTHPANAALVGGTQTFAITFKTATVTGWTVTATTTGLTTNTIVSGAIPVTAGAALQLQILAPGETAAPGTASGKTGAPTARTAGVSFNVTVNAVDANWNLVASSTPLVSITTSDALATTPPNAALVAGTGTFALTMATAGSGFTITATDTNTGLAPATVTGITVNAGAVTSLQFQVNPQRFQDAGIVMSPAIEVYATDVYGNNVSGANVTITATDGITPATMTGTTTVATAAITGIATFSNIAVNTPGTWHLVATSGAVTADSTDFDINVGAIDHYTLTAATATRGTPFNITVTAFDAGNNLVDYDSITDVTLSSTNAHVQFDGDGNSTFGEPADATKILSAGTFTISTRDIYAESVTITALDGNLKTGSVTVNVLNASGDYRSLATGTYGTAGNWQIATNTAGVVTWATAGTAPTSATTSQINVRTHTMTLGTGVSLTAQLLVVDSGGTVSLGTGSNVLTLNNAVVNGVISGTGRVTASGSGNVVEFNNTNSYTGSTAATALTIDAATVTATNVATGANSSVGNTANGVTFTNGGTLRVTMAAAQTATRLFTFNTGGGTLDLRSNTLTLNTTANRLTGAGLITKAGDGGLTLSVGNNFSGGLSILDGTVTGGAAGSLGTSDVTVAAGKQLAISATAMATSARLFLNSVGASFANVNIAAAVNQQLSALYFDGAVQATGTWGSSGAGVTNVDNSRFGGTGRITVSPTGITITAVTATKVYDGTVTATGTPTVTGTLAAGDTATTTQVYQTKTAGTNNKVLIPSVVILNSSNVNVTASYALTLVNFTTGTISQKALTMTGLSVPSTKVFDGTTTAVVTGTPALAASEPINTGTTSDGKPYTGDVVSITGTATGNYNSRNVANAATVAFGGLSLAAGGDNANYSLTIQSPAAATITPKALTITGVSAVNKRWSGTTAATLSGTAAFQAAEAAGTGSTSDGKPYTVDTVTVGGTPTATFSDANVGNGKTVTVTGYTVTGTVNSNYTVTQPTFTANITRVNRVF